MPGSYTYRPPTTLVTLITILMVAYAVLSLVAVWSGWLELQIFQDAMNGQAVDDDRAEASDARQAVIGFCQTGLMVVLAILFLVWINRANKNARALGAQGMVFTPGWCVGWFFVPLFNLFRPYQAVKEIWKASDPDHPGYWRTAPATPWLGLWWTLWLVSNILGQIASRIRFRSEDLHALHLSSWLLIVSDALDIPLSILALSIVRSIHQMQERKMAKPVPVLEPDVEPNV